MLAMFERNGVAKANARDLGVTTTSLYAYVNGDGNPSCRTGIA
jgi:DNA-binding phage protein